MLYISPAYEQVWGRTCDSLYRNPMAWLEAIIRRTGAGPLGLARGKCRGEPVESEYRIRTPDGVGNGSATERFRFAMRPAK